MNAIFLGKDLADRNSTILSPLKDFVLKAKLFTFSIKKCPF